MFGHRDRIAHRRSRPGACQNRVIASDDVDPRSVCIEHVRRALLREIGTAEVEGWLGKDGLVTFDVATLASIAVAALAPVLDEAAAADRVVQLHREQVFAPPIHLDPNDW